MTKIQDPSETEAFEGFEPPQAQGLFDPAYEHDACGVGFIADLKGAQVAPDRRGRARTSSRTSSIAAPSAPIRSPATAPAS